MIRSFILAALLSAAASASAWGQAGCDDIQELGMDKVQERANAVFDAGKTAADEAYREEFQAASAVYADDLASSEAAYDGSLYWAFRSAEQLNHSAVAEPVAAAAAKRAHDRNAAHREWAASVSDMVTRWSASMEDAEARRSAFLREKVPLIEEQFSHCR